MFGENFYVFTDNGLSYGAKSIYCVRKCGAGWQDLEYMFVQEDGTTGWKRFEQHSSPKPFIIIPWELREDFFPKLAAMLDASGIKTESTHKLEGMLEAQNAHLQDMRKLVCRQASIEYTPPERKTDANKT